MNRQATAGGSTDSATRDGVICALLAYSSWGFLPIYFKILESVASTEVLAHRIVWAVPFGALIVAWRRQGGALWAALVDRRMLLTLTISAAVIAVNWLIYIYAVQSGQIFQASLGYYINPLVYVLVGVVLYREKLTSLQLAAVASAAIGVLVLTISGGEFPLIALSLAVSFTIYGVIRKNADVGGMPGLLVETIVLLPFALAWLAWLSRQGSAAFGADDPGLAVTLILAGPITVLPLLFFALAARRLPLSLLGFLQFIAPTLQFVMGVLYGEALTLPHAVCFGCIWLAVVLFVSDAWRRR